MEDEFLHQRLEVELNQQRALLQGAAGAAIAFALHQTANEACEWQLAPIGLAVLAWAISFSAGILNSHARQGASAATLRGTSLRLTDGLQKRTI